MTVATRRALTNDFLVLLGRRFTNPPRARTLRTLKGKITYSDAADQEHNILQQLTYWQKREELIGYLLRHAKEIEVMVSCYLRLKGSEECRLSPCEDWIHGSFNICLPVYVDNWSRRPGGRVIVRFPLPFKVGESNHPGNTEEKVRCEVATYAWIRENCVDVPIPYLWGFAFAGAEGADGSSVSDSLIHRREMLNVFLQCGTVRHVGECTLSRPTLRGLSAPNLHSSWPCTSLPLYPFRSPLQSEDGTSSN